ncbi:MAG: glycosyltransferase [Pseudorhodoplanes sp.]|uniref:glycosyltransferase n=1 Tax=Pseudorhodoplanes sp. TaxID=1934341 RepID=UPI003D0BAB6E
MRIVCFLPDFGGGGAQRTLINLAACFRQAGHDVTLAAAQRDGPALAWVDPQLRTVPVGRGQLRNAVLPLARLIRRQRPEVVLSSVLDANVVAVAARALSGSRETKLVVRETNSHRARGDIGRLRQQLTRFSYPRADAVVALSEGVRQELIADYALPPASVVTIHNPIEVDALSAEAKLAQTPPVEKNGPWIIGVGRLIRQKGFDRLIRAVADLKRPEMRLVLVGEGPDRDALAAKARDLGVTLHMPGFVRQPVHWLAHADVFVLSSRWEGFGHVIVEAMAAGAPVVAFDCPHGPRDIIVDGVNGLLVSDGDLAALSGAMAALLDDRDLARRLSAAAMADAARFSSARIADSYLKLFSSL